MKLSDRRPPQRDQQQLTALHSSAGAPNVDIGQQVWDLSSIKAKLACFLLYAAAVTANRSHRCVSLHQCTCV